MRIHGSSPTSSLAKPSASKGKGGAKRSKGDSVQVSDAAGLRERAKVMLADMPDVRLDKIEEIRDALENGSYQMDSKAVSTYIVRNALSERSWGVGMLNQNTQQSTHHIPDELHQILNDMSACITEQENIIVEERDAMKVFDAESLTNLVERRARSQSTLDELESRCKRMMGLSDQHKTMEHLIDAYADYTADALQGMRIELMRRMQILEKDHVENHLKLRAAWTVTTNILQQVGAIEVPQTYQNTTYSAQQASR